MNFATYIIKSSDKDDLKTEIIYNVKSALVEKAGIVVFRFVADVDWSVQRERITKILRSLKRLRMIEFFSHAADLEECVTMESVYLLNKYPDITETVDTKDKCVIIKI